MPFKKRGGTLMSTILPATIGLPVGAAAPKIRPIQLGSVVHYLATVMGDKRINFSTQIRVPEGEVVFTVKNERDLQAFLRGMGDLRKKDPVLEQELIDLGINGIDEPKKNREGSEIKVHLHGNLNTHILVKVVLKASGFTRSEEAKIEVGAPQGMSVLMGSVSLRNSQQALVLVDEAIREVINDPGMKGRLGMEGFENLEPSDLPIRIEKCMGELHSVLLKQALTSQTRTDGLLKMSLASVVRDFLEKRLS